jgi:threonine/homoserine/homoserine lactone efflux protein
MSKFLSVLALAGGIWLIYLGYERQISIAGHADRTLSRLGTAIDGGDHTPTHTKYYIAGALLALVGVFGLGIVKS